MNAATQRSLILAGLALLVTLITVVPASASSAPRAQSVLTGRLSVEVLDDFTSDQAVYRSYLQVGERKVRLRGLNANRTSGLFPGSLVTLSGHHELGGFRTDGTIRELAAPKRREQAEFSGPRKVLLIVGTGADPSLVSQAVFGETISAKKMMELQSGGSQTLVGDVVGPFPTVPGAGCPVQQGTDTLKAAAQAAGIDLKAYDHEAYILPPDFKPSECGWSGMGVLGAPYITPQRAGLVALMPTGAYAKRLLAETVVHEIGHNLGLGHARSIDCEPSNGSWTPLPPLVDGSRPCAEEEYGDVNDYMGSAPGATGAWNLARLGARSLESTVLATSVGTYAIGEVLDRGATARELRIPWNVEAGGRVLGYLSIEARRTLLSPTFGFFDIAQGSASAQERMKQGVLIRGVRVWGDGLFNEVYGSDVFTYRTPESGFAKRSQIWPVGATLDDPSRQVRIRVLSASPGGAEIAVEQLPDLRDTLPPSKPSSLEGEQWEGNPHEALIDWQASKDNKKVTRYKVFESGKPVAEVDAKDGGSERVSATVPFDDAKSSNRYAVQAFDAAGNASEVSEYEDVKRQFRPRPRRIGLSKLRWQTSKRSRQVSATFRASIGTFSLEATKKSGRSSRRKGRCSRTSSSDATSCRIRLGRGKWAVRLVGRERGYATTTWQKRARF